MRCDIRPDAVRAAGSLTQQSQVGSGVPDAHRAHPSRAHRRHVVDPQRCGVPDPVQSNRARLGERGGAVRCRDRVVHVLDVRGVIHTHTRAGAGGGYSRGVVHAEGGARTRRAASEGSEVSEKGGWRGASHPIRSHYWQLN